MTYDGLVVAAVVSELRRTILHARVQKVRQHNQTDITIELRAPGHSPLILLSVDARFPRLYLTVSSAAAPRQAPSFCMLLRKYLHGALVVGIEQLCFDRIVRFGFDTSEHGELALILEIMGKHSNLILTNAENRILGAIKHIGSSVSRYRQVLPGRDYLSPPGAEKIDPRTVDARTVQPLIARALPEAPEPKAVRDWLVATFAGFGPFLANEVLARATSRGALTVQAVADALSELSETLRAEAFSPVFVTSETGRDLMAYPIPSAQFAAEQQHARHSINESLDALFRGLVARTRLDDLRGQLLTAIRRAAASRKQTLRSAERTLAESEKAARYKELGEILLSSLHAIASGATSVSVTDFFDPECGQVEIELDAKLTPQQNAERYFRRYRKAREAASMAPRRIAQLQDELELLERARKDTEAAQSEDLLAGLRAMLADRGLLRQEAAQTRESDEFAGHRIRRTVTSDGWEILYGETAQANDHLTLHIARPNDIWLHARQVTGAHVIIRAAGSRAAPPRPVLLEAALIAARNSEARHSSLVAVDYTPRKHVRRPRGAAAGFVIYRNEKTIDISPNLGGRGPRRAGG